MIDKDLQDLAWRCLPREFKEEVKIYYQYAYVQYGKSDLYRGSANAIESLFGYHNPSSDAEGEDDEMLYVSRKQVQEMYDALQSEQERKDLELYNQVSAEDRAAMLFDLFGSKCLLDNVANEVNFASKESKFRKGDKFRYKKNPGEVYTVDHITNDGKVYYWDKDADGVSKAYFVNPDYIEPYTEPEEESLQMKPIESKVSVYLATKEEEEEFRLLLHENGFTWNSGTSLKGCSFWVNHTEESKILYVHPDMTVTYWGNKTPDTLTFSEFKKRYFKCNDHIAQDHDMVDGIIKHGFKNHNRLHIAAMMMQGMLSNTTRFSSYEISDLVRISLNCADALLREAEKGGSK